eukprot:scaffold78980_cov35-Attheya_sp.AAC.1
MARDPVLAFVVAHVFAIVVPDLVFSLTGVLDQHPLVSIVFPEAQITELISNGLTKDLFECFLILVLMFGVGYWRLYVDGPEHHPILLCMGGIRKLMVASIMYCMYK